MLLGAVPLRLEQSTPAGTGRVTGVAISGILLPMPLKPPEGTKEKQVHLRPPDTFALLASVAHPPSFDRTLPESTAGKQTLCLTGSLLPGRG